MPDPMLQTRTEQTGRVLGLQGSHSSEEANKPPDNYSRESTVKGGRTQGALGPATEKATQN